MKHCSEDGATVMVCARGVHDNFAMPLALQRIFEEQIHMLKARHLLARTSSVRGGVTWKYICIYIYIYMYLFACPFAVS